MAIALAAVFICSISGSSPVTVIAIGGMMYPALVSNGYDERESIGLHLHGAPWYRHPSIDPDDYLRHRRQRSTGRRRRRPLSRRDRPGLLIGGMLAAFCVGRALQLGKSHGRPRRIGFTVVVPFVGYIGQAGTRLVTCLVPLPSLSSRQSLPAKNFSKASGPDAARHILGGILGLFTPTEAAPSRLCISRGRNLITMKWWKDLPGCWPTQP